MVLSAVFIPMAFFGGSTGVIYRQSINHDCVSHAALSDGGIESDASALRFDSETDR